MLYFKGPSAARRALLMCSSWQPPAAAIALKQPAAATAVPHSGVKGTAAAAAAAVDAAAAPRSSRIVNNELRFLHTVPAAPGDRVVSAQLLQQPEELLQFAAASSSLNLATLQQTLRQLAKASKDPAAAAAMQQDERMHQLLQQIQVKLGEADGRMLAQLARALALLRINNLYTQQVRSRILCRL